MALGVSTMLWAGLLVAQAPAQAKTPPLPTGWQLHKSVKGAYQAAFPGKPTEIASKKPRGTAEISFYVTTYRSSGMTFSVASGDLGGRDASPGPMLDAARDAAVKTLKGKLISEENVDYSGHPGRKLEIEVPKNVIAGGAVARVRLFVVGKRLYELAAIKPTRTAQLTRDVDLFFAQFQPADPPAADPGALAKADTKKTAAAKADMPKADPAPAPAATKADAKVDPPFEPIDTRIAKHTGWRVFMPREGGMTVEIPPFEPQRDEFTFDHPEFGRTTDATYFMKVDGIVYLISVEDITTGRSRSAELQQAHLEGIAGAMLLRGGGGRPVSKKAIKVNGWPAIEFEHEYTGKSASTTHPLLGRGRGRAVLGLSKEYLIVAVVEQGQKVNEADIDAFLNSLAVLGDPAEALGEFAAGGKVLEINGPPERRPFGLIPYNDPTGSFNVMFPRPPGAPTQVAMSGPNGENVMTTVLKTQDGTEGTHILLYQDLPPDAIKREELSKLFDGAVQAIGAQAARGKTVKTQEIRLMGFPGRDMSIEMDDDRSELLKTQVLMRVVMVKNRLYILAVIGPKSLVDLNGAEFIDSFRPTAKAK